MNISKITTNILKLLFTTFLIFFGPILRHFASASTPCRLSYDTFSVCKNCIHRIFCRSFLKLITYFVQKFNVLRMLDILRSASRINDKSTLIFKVQNHLLCSYHYLNLRHHLCHHRIICYFAN